MSKTIVAASTPIGGAVAIIRISGDKSKEIIKKLCNKELSEYRRAYFTEIDTGVIKDKCVVLIYKEGHSYTGEESAEIFCHGSEVIVKEITEFCIRNGASLAERGEFTLRAYQNKRMDLSEAEGVLDLINAETVEQANNAYDSVNGKIRKEIEELQRSLKEIIAKVDVAIDYPEEDIEEETKQQAVKGIREIISRIKKLIGSYKDGYKIKNGVKVVICGKPNVGKSELFNAMIGTNRAIVSDKEGTTRDFIESEYIYKDRKFVLVDTAGLRETTDDIERKGVNLALSEINSADLILGVGVKEAEFTGREKNTLVVTNKCDLCCGNGFNVSAKQKIGIEKLKEEIYRLTNFDAKGIKINNIRQYQALVSAGEFLDSACKNDASLDCFASDLFCAFECLGKVTGVIGSDEIIAEIFSRFCVGK